MSRPPCTGQIHTSCPHIRSDLLRPHTSAFPRPSTTNLCPNPLCRPPPCLPRRAEGKMQCMTQECAALQYARTTGMHRCRILVSDRIAYVGDGCASEQISAQIWSNRAAHRPKPHFWPRSVQCWPRFVDFGASVVRIGQIGANSRSCACKAPELGEADSGHVSGRPPFSHGGLFCPTPSSPSRPPAHTHTQNSPEEG